MTNSNLKISAALEAILFIYGEPMPIKKIAALLQINENDVKRSADQLRENFKSQNRGLIILENNEELQLATLPEYAPLIKKLTKGAMREALTPATQETLAIVAYVGPIGRNEIEYIRGVNSSFTLRNLLIRGLIDRTPDPNRGSAYLYTLSIDALKYLNIQKTEELPEFKKYRDIGEALRKQLSQ